MRQIEKEMNQAIKAGRDYKKSNTTVICGGVRWDYDTNTWVPVLACVYLHGNLICTIEKDGRRRFSCCGWHTPTTRSRLQALGASCRIKDFQMIDSETGRPFYCGRL